MFDTIIDKIATAIAAMVDTLWADLVRPIILMAVSYTVFAVAVAGVIVVVVVAFRLVAVVWSRARHPQGPH